MTGEVEARRALDGITRHVTTEVDKTATKLLMGRVISYDNDTGDLNVALSGETSGTPGIRAFRGAALEPNDPVYLLKKGRQYVVLGSTKAAAPVDPGPPGWDGLAQRIAYWDPVIGGGSRQDLQVLLQSILTGPTTQFLGASGAADGSDLPVDFLAPPASVAPFVDSGTGLAPADNTGTIVGRCQLLMGGIAPVFSPLDPPTDFGPMNVTIEVGGGAPCNFVIPILYGVNPITLAFYFPDVTVADGEGLAFTVSMFSTAVAAAGVTADATINGHVIYRPEISNDDPHPCADPEGSPPCG